MGHLQVSNKPRISGAYANSFNLIGVSQNWIVFIIIWNLLLDIKTKLGNQSWEQLLSLLKANCNPGQDLKISYFAQCLKSIKYNLSPQQQELLVSSYPGKDQGNNHAMNFQTLLQVEKLLKIQNTYDAVNANQSDSDESIADLNGFICTHIQQFSNYHQILIGEVRRSKKKLPPLTYDQISTALASAGENDFLRVLRNIASIDQDNNGYVTVTELDDILKLQYPKSFEGRDNLFIHFRFTSYILYILLHFSLHKAFQKHLKQSPRRLQQSQDPCDGANQKARCNETQH